MLEDLKKEALKEIKERMVELEADNEKLTQTIKEKEEQAKMIQRIAAAPSLDERVRNYKQNYSKISKFFNKKKYQTGLNELGRNIKDESNAKIEELREEIKKAKETIEANKEEINRLLKELDRIDKANSVEGLDFTLDKANELLTRQRKSFSDYSYDEIFKLRDNLDFTGSELFMKRAISDNPFNIIYDQTLDYGMYYSFINGLKYHYGNNEGIFDRHKKEVLDLLHKSKNGEIRIKLDYLLEAIRFYFKDVITYNTGLFHEETNDDDILDALTRISRVCERSLALPDEEYHMLEKMYDPDEYDYLCHKTTGTITKETLESILSNGLRSSSEAMSIVHTGTNARRVGCFLAIAGYDNFYGGHGSKHSNAEDNHRIIMQIPKGTTYFFGSDQMNGEESYFLPEFIIAYIHDKVGENGMIASSDLHFNDRERRQYPYLFKNGYDISKPSAYQNPDYGNSEEMGRRY